MSFLRFHRVAFAWTNGVSLFEDVSFQLEQGWTGLVGQNGSGKSTLLKLITEELQPTEGHVQRQPEWGVVRRCTQEVERPTEDVLALADTTRGAARRVMGELHVQPERLAEWDVLSPGERKRWQIAGALADEPELLLLDEPTNHLDAQGRDWLLTALRGYRGVGIVVSHDRGFLDALTTRTLRVHRGTVELWAGGYSAARVEWEREAAQRQALREQRKEEQAKVARRVDDKRRALAATVAQKSTGKRMKNKYDSDARGILAQTKVAWAEANYGRQLGVLNRMQERADEAVDEVEIEKQLGGSVFVDFHPSPNPFIATVDGPELERLVAPIRGVTQLGIGRLDRIHLAGPNGAGKTTLLHALRDSLRVPEERVLYLPQELDEEEQREAIATLRELPKQERGRVLSIVAALGVDPDRLLATESPSPGEARKALLARGLAQHAWALILDEPTNHLDLPSIERLQQALVAYPGALLLVTHDDALAAATTNTRWRLGDGTVEVTSVG